MNIEELFINIDMLPNVLEDNELSELFLLVEKGNQIAREKIINHNIKLVLYIVGNKFNNTLFDKKELVAVGNIGLLKAVDSFDISRNIQFSTYASKCINNEIFMFLRKNNRHQNIDSIDKLFYNNDGEMKITIEESISDDFDVTNNYIATELYSCIQDIVINLPKREKEIIMMRFGFINDKIYSQKEIAKKYNISQSYVSRLITKILREIEIKLVENEFIEEKKKCLKICKTLTNK